jgi:nucleoid DNA-binding protein
MENEPTGAPKAGGRPRAPTAAGKDALVDFVSEHLDTSKRDARLIVEGVVAGVTSLSKLHGGMRVPGLGNFAVLVTAPRAGRNPRTGESVPIGPGRRVTFRAAKSFKDSLAGRQS